MAGGPIIGVAAALERARWSFWDQQAHLVPDSYVAAVRAAGGQPVLLPAGDPREVDGALALVDGLLLVGGADVAPERYGAAPDPLLEGTCAPRDAFELALVERAVAHELPVLGICRGMQVLNVALGGTLVQDLGVAGVDRHRPQPGVLAGTEHDVTLVPGSMVHELAGEGSWHASSHHHQAVGRPGQGLVVTAHAADGVPEALERADDALLGVQWHPEAEVDSPLFRWLVEAAQRRVAEVAA